MEQMGLPYHPTHINRENQMDARQSYADLLEYPQTYHMNWTLWNGGTTRRAAVVRSRLRAPAGRQRPPLRWPESDRDGNGGDQNARGASRRQAAGFLEFPVSLFRL